MSLPFTPYRELATLIARFATTDGDIRTPVDGLFIGRRSAPGDPVHKGQHACFALVAQGAKSVTVGGETHHYGVGTCMVVSLDLPVISCVTEASPDVPQLGVGMLINGERLREVIARLPVPHPAFTTPVRGVGVNQATPELLDAMIRLLRLLDTPADIPAMAPLIEQEILYRLLTGPDGPRLLNIARADTPGNRIARAVAWLREHYARPLRIEDLAGDCGMSVSSLHHHFKAVTALTPVQYQKQLRLHEARRLMLVESCDAGTAGHRVGYLSPSQFSREYSRLYGCPPARDIESLRLQA
ncbi:MAG: AraC family transcriptional regulator [Asticcacaulis sp.]|uniref:AraC family transcriptional regulator n=1 Tax=Asticcacaulis sp. TaxID=1872648 RepID=UPI0039E3545E